MKEKAAVRTKFKCSRVAHNASGVTEAYLAPVLPQEDKEGVNKKWWEATPSGSLELHIHNPAAAAAFRAGAFYYVDFTETE